MADKRRVSESEQLVNLWGHEATRTFSDRLVNLEDKEWFVEQVKAATSPLYLPISPYISPASRRAGQGGGEDALQHELRQAARRRGGQGAPPLRPHP